MDCNYLRDCTTVPIPKKCVSFCLEGILRNSTIEENQLILGLNPDLSLAVYNAYNGFRDINLFEDLRAELSSERLETLMAKFEHINQYQLNYFKKSGKNRAIVINAIRNLGLDHGNNLNFDSGTISEPVH